MRFREAVNDFLLKKKRIRTESRPRLSGKVATVRLTEGARNIRIVSYKTTVNTCLSFLNEVMASEPPFRGAKRRCKSE
ncbi:MAG: hypothetical protein E6Z24_04320 [Dialister sp.]|nr:hypothetical protein [Dialister sp.]